ncbi:DMT family transporter [Endozoicomonas sp. 8E]|uniref:DMT family transporter n=1 Tax=Endozoicomonas sp. 8E TaxID=3035692 RepID=UPI002938D94A|nr:DMT family transporter [Endozoicomonas sp. 8E]WOG25517.1 DMT family transporter [Endozoicomonas sp. 8E]
MTVKTYFLPLLKSWERLTQFQQGVIMALTSNALFVFVGTLVRQISDHISLFQVLLVRQLVFLLLLVPSLKIAGSSIFKPEALPLHGLRILGAFLYLYFGFVSVSNLPLADATALSFTSVLFVALIAKLWLGENVGWKRALTIFVGFSGILLITQPGFDNPKYIYIISGLIAALGGAIAATCVRKLSQSQPRAILLSYQAFSVGLITLVPAIANWKWPDWWQTGLLLLIGTLSSLATSAGVISYQKAPANVASNLGYGQIVFALILGYWLFDETPNVLALTGVGLLFGSALVPFFRQSYLNK